MTKREQKLILNFNCFLEEEEGEGEGKGEGESESESEGEDGMGANDRVAKDTAAKDTIYSTTINSTTINSTTINSTIINSTTINSINTKNNQDTTIINPNIKDTTTEIKEKQETETEIQQFLVNLSSPNKHLVSLSLKFFNQSKSKRVLCFVEMPLVLKIVNLLDLFIDDYNSNPESISFTVNSKSVSCANSNTVTTRIFPDPSAQTQSQSPMTMATEPEFNLVFLNEILSFLTTMLLHFKNFNFKHFELVSKSILNLKSCGSRVDNLLQHNENGSKLVEFLHVLLETSQRYTIQTILRFILAFTIPAKGYTDTDPDQNDSVSNWRVKEKGASISTRIHSLFDWNLKPEKAFLAIRRQKLDENHGDRLGIEQDVYALVESNKCDIRTLYILLLLTNPSRTFLASRLVDIYRDIHHDDPWLINLIMQKTETLLPPPPPPRRVGGQGAKLLASLDMGLRNERRDLFRKVIKILIKKTSATGNGHGDPSQAKTKTREKSLGIHVECHLKIYEFMFKIVSRLYPQTEIPLDVHGVFKEAHKPLPMLALTAATKPTLSHHSWLLLALLERYPQYIAWYWNDGPGRGSSFEPRDQDSWYANIKTVLQVSNLVLALVQGAKSQSWSHRLSKRQSTTDSSKVIDLLIQSLVPGIQRHDLTRGLTFPSATVAVATITAVTVFLVNLRRTTEALGKESGEGRKVREGVLARLPSVSVLISVLPQSNSPSDPKENNEDKNKRNAVLVEMFHCYLLVDLKQVIKTGFRPERLVFMDGCEAAIRKSVVACLLAMEKAGVSVRYEIAHHKRTCLRILMDWLVEGQIENGLVLGGVFGSNKEFATRLWDAMINYNDACSGKEGVIDWIEECVLNQRNRMGSFNSNSNSTNEKERDEIVTVSFYSFMIDKCAKEQVYFLVGYLWRECIYLTATATTTAATEIAKSFFGFVKEKLESRTMSDYTDGWNVLIVFKNWLEYIITGSVSVSGCGSLTVEVSKAFEILDQLKSMDSDKSMQPISKEACLSHPSIHLSLLSPWTIKFIDGLFGINPLSFSNNWHLLILKFPMFKTEILFYINLVGFTAREGIVDKSFIKMAESLEVKSVDKSHKSDNKKSGLSKLITGFHFLPVQSKKLSDKLCLCTTKILAPLDLGDPVALDKKTPTCFEQYLVAFWTLISYTQSMTGTRSVSGDSNLVAALTYLCRLDQTHTTLSTHKAFLSLFMPSPAQIPRYSEAVYFAVARVVAQGGRVQKQPFVDRFMTSLGEYSTPNPNEKDLSQQPPTSPERSELKQRLLQASFLCLVDTLDHQALVQILLANEAGTLFILGMVLGCLENHVGLAEDGRVLYRVLKMWIKTCMHDTGQHKKHNEDSDSSLAPEAGHFPLGAFVRRLEGLERMRFVGLVTEQDISEMVIHGDSDGFGLACFMAQHSNQLAQAVCKVFLERHDFYKQVSGKGRYEYGREYRLLSSLTVLFFNRDELKWSEEIPKIVNKVVKKISKGIKKLGREFGALKVLEGENGLKATARDSIVIFAMVDLLGKGYSDDIIDEIESFYNSPVTVERATGFLLIALDNLCNMLPTLLIRGCLSQGRGGVVLVSHCLSFISTIIQRVGKQRDPESLQVQAKLERLIHVFSGLIPGLCGVISKVSTLLASNLLIACLKYRISDPFALDFISLLIKHGAELQSAPEKLLRTTMSHSKFDSIVLAQQGFEIEERGTCAKASLLRFLLVIISRNPVACFDVELANKLALGYGGTIQESDKAALDIFKMYETKGRISMANYVFRWGNQIENQYLSTDCLADIDATRMANTLDWFAVQNDNDNTAARCGVFSEKVGPLYDVLFFLSLTAGILNTKIGALYPRRMVEVNLIGLAVTAMSSQSLEYRKLGHYIVGEFYRILPEYIVPEKNQILLLLTQLQTAFISTPQDMYPIIPGIIASFVSQGLMIMLKPESEIYRHMNLFLIHSKLESNEIPIFSKLLYSATPEARRERIWLLRLLANGFKNSLDYRVCNRKHVVPIILSFFSSPLADLPMRKLIFGFLLKACSIPSVSAELVTKGALILFFKTFCAKIEISQGQGKQGVGCILAFPVLIMQCLQSFSDCPGSFYGRIGKHEWMRQFVDVGKFLIESIPAVLKTNEKWAGTFILRIIRIVYKLLNTGLCNAAFSNEHMLIIHEALEQLEKERNVDEALFTKVMGKDIFTTGVDMDGLFDTEQQADNQLLMREAFFDIFCLNGLDWDSKMGPEIPISLLTSGRNKILVVETIIRQLFKNPLKCQFMTQTTGWGPDVKNKVLGFLLDCYFSDATVNIESEEDVETATAVKERCKTCLVLFVRESDDSILETIPPNLFESILTPEFLLDQGQKRNDDENENDLEADDDETLMFDTTTNNTFKDWDFIFSI